MRLLIIAVLVLSFNFVNAQKSESETNFKGFYIGNFIGIKIPNPEIHGNLGNQGVNASLIMQTGWGFSYSFNFLSERIKDEDGNFIEGGGWFSDGYERKRSEVHSLLIHRSFDTKHQRLKFGLESGMSKTYTCSTLDDKDDNLMGFIGRAHITYFPANFFALQLGLVTMKNRLDTHTGLELKIMFGLMDLDN